MWFFIFLMVFSAQPTYALTCHANVSVPTVGGLSNAEGQNFLKSVNSIRLEVSNPYPNFMYVLDWDNDLAQEAQLAIKNTCSSSSDPSPLSTPQLQGLGGFTTVGQAGPNKVVNTADLIGGILSIWNNNKFYYSSNDCALAKTENTVCGSCDGGSTQGEMQPCLAYTQLIWATTHAVGCGIANCSGNTFFSCLFGPTGNMIGETPYNRSSVPLSICSYYSSGSSDEPSDDDGFFDTGKEWKIPLVAVGAVAVIVAGGAVYFCEGEDCSSGSKSSNESGNTRRRRNSKTTQFAFPEDGDGSLQQLNEVVDLSHA